MANTIKLKRRIGGSQAAPGGGSEGEVAVYFPGTAGATTKPVIYLHDGAGYRIANPDTAVTVGVETLPGGTQGSSTGIGAAYGAIAVASRKTDPIIIATFASTAYVRTGPGTADGDWTALGAATAVATDIEVHNGADNTKMITSQRLRGETRQVPTNAANLAGDEGRIPRLTSLGTLDPHFIPQAAPAGAGGVGGDVSAVIAGITPNFFLTPQSLEMRVARTANATPANDAGKLPALDTSGKIPAAFLPAGGLQFTGNKDLTVPYVAPATGAGPKNGDLAFVSKAGPLGTGWAAVIVNPPATVGVGDMLVYEGGTVNKWHITASDVDVSGYVPKDGATTMGATARMNFAAAAPASGAAPAVMIDGGANAGSIENAYINCGTY